MQLPYSQTGTLEHDSHLMDIQSHIQALSPLFRKYLASSECIRNGSSADSYEPQSEALPSHYRFTYRAMATSILIGVQSL